MGYYLRVFKMFPLLDLRYKNNYNEYTSNFRVSHKKHYEIFLFFYNNDKIIFRDDCDIWDTVRGYPQIDEDDNDALERFTREQFNIKINLNKIKFILKDNLDNKFYFYNMDLCGDKYKFIDNSNYYRYEKNIDYFIYFNITTLFCELFNLNRRDKQKRRKKRLINLGLITNNHEYCEKCDGYYCICNSKRTRFRTSSSVNRHRMRH